MDKAELRNQIEKYLIKHIDEVECAKKMIEFLKNGENCFERKNRFAHFTGSAWIVNKNRDQVLLTLHRKLDKWLQLGGHADGEENLIKVAKREAYEESGLSKVKLITPEILDIDIHLIPIYKDIPHHFHYDIRFLFEADENLQIKITNESKDLAWWHYQDLAQISTSETKLLRMASKSNNYKQ